MSQLEELTTGILELGKLLAGYGMLMATFASADAFAEDFKPDGLPDLTEELIATQRRWATVLNERDGGTRHGFLDFSEWIARLEELRRLRRPPETPKVTSQYISYCEMCPNRGRSNDGNGHSHGVNRERKEDRRKAERTLSRARKGLPQSPRRPLR